MYITRVDFEDESFVLTAFYFAFKAKQGSSPFTAGIICEQNGAIYISVAEVLLCV